MTKTFIYPNLTTPDQYRRLLTQFANTLMHEPIMVRDRKGRKVVNARRYDVEAKMAAANAEANERFGHKTMNPNAYCTHCGKPVVSISEFSVMMAGADATNEGERRTEILASYCKMRRCVKVAIT